MKIDEKKKKKKGSVFSYMCIALTRHWLTHDWKSSSNDIFIFRPNIVD